MVLYFTHIIDYRTCCIIGSIKSGVMKMKQVRWFIFTNAKASLWLIYYILIQAIVGSGVIIWFALHDYEFGVKFLTLYEPVLQETDFIKQQELSMRAMLELCADKLGLLVGLSSAITIMGIVVLFKLRKKPIFEKISLSNLLLYLAIGVVLNLIVTLVVASLPHTWTSSHSQVTSQILSGNLMFNILGTGILVPVTEELIFRFGVQQSLSKFNVKFAIVYQAILFGTLHGNMVQALYGFALGLLFGYIFYKKGSIVYTILLHIGVNLSSVIAAEQCCTEPTALFLIAIFTGLLYGLSKPFAFCQKRI